MAPFIVTLAVLLGLKGLALVLASQDLLIANPGFFARIANGSVFGVNNLIWVLMVVYALGGALLNHTRFGAAIFALGGNEEAARMLGVRVERVKIPAYGLSGALAGLSGALLASRLDSGLSRAGTGFELQSIAAAVIGGVGTMAGPLAGVLLLGVIDNVINQVGTLSPYLLSEPRERCVPARRGDRADRANRPPAWRRAGCGCDAAACCRGLIVDGVSICRLRMGLSNPFG